MKPINYILLVIIFISGFTLKVAQSTGEVNEILPTIKTEPNKELSILSVREKNSKKIIEDEIFVQISKDFETNLVFMEENRIRVTLRIADAKYQQFLRSRTYYTILKGD